MTIVSLARGKACTSEAVLIAGAHRSYPRARSAALRPQGSCGAPGERGGDGGRDGRRRGGSGSLSLAKTRFVNELAEQSTLDGVAARPGDRQPATVNRWPSRGVQAAPIHALLVDAPDGRGAQEPSERTSPLASISVTQKAPITPAAAPSSIVITSARREGIQRESSGASGRRAAREPRPRRSLGAGSARATVMRSAVASSGPAWIVVGHGVFQARSERSPGVRPSRAASQLHSSLSIDQRTEWTAARAHRRAWPPGARGRTGTGSRSPDGRRVREQPRV